MRQSVVRTNNPTSVEQKNIYMLLVGVHTLDAHNVILPKTSLKELAKCSKIGMKPLYSGLFEHALFSTYHSRPYIWNGWCREYHNMLQMSHFLKSKSNGANPRWGCKSNFDGAVSPMGRCVHTNWGAQYRGAVSPASSLTIVGAAASSQIASTPV